MHAADRLVRTMKTLSKNIYGKRGKLDDCYAADIRPQEKERPVVSLQESEEGEDALKSAYVERLAALKTLRPGDPIVSQYFESDKRPRAVLPSAKSSSTTGPSQRPRRRNLY
jgi:heat shock protein 4